MTIRLALHRLAREGFVEAKRRLGTFMVDKPPHINNSALVFWNDPASPQTQTSWSK